MTARALPSWNECPATWVGGAQNPWGSYRSCLDQSGEERPRRLFLATCSLQLPWEVQERTQSGSPHSYTLKAQESFAAPKAGLFFSLFFQEKNFVLCYNFLEIAVMSEKMQNKITKVFYSPKHKICLKISLNLKNWTWNSQEHIFSHFRVNF